MWRLIAVKRPYIRCLLSYDDTFNENVVYGNLLTNTKWFKPMNANISRVILASVGTDNEVRKARAM